jgi:hypothetical protein
MSLKSSSVSSFLLFLPNATSPEFFSTFTTITVTAPITDTTILTYLKAKTITDFKAYVENLPVEQQLRFVDIAIKNKIVDYEKAMFLKELTGRDIMKIIQLNEEE